MASKTSIVAEEYIDNDGDNRFVDIHNRFLQEW